MLQPSTPDVDLNGVHAAIDSQTILNDVILDIQQYDDTLVIFTSQDTSHTFIRLILRKVWTGPLEIYCAIALMSGSDRALS
jgi:hypothetical protein